MHNGKEPRKLVPLSKTRWLVWLPAADVIFDQWYELQGFFTMKGAGRKVRYRFILPSAWFYLSKSILNEVDHCSRVTRKRQTLASCTTRPTCCTWFFYGLSCGGCKL